MRDDFQDDLTRIPEVDLRPEAQPVPERVGHFHLVRRIGEGGMGEVWEAEQSEPVRRLVAIKLIKPGMDSKEIVARFEAERQALAVMDHPGIAHVYDGGASESGRPYFVMELVRGSPITEYCDRHRLSLARRLELFVPVCRAVQHAHQKGVIHRDLKPSNILVSEREDGPLPVIIDFGIAKATGQQLAGRAQATVSGQLVGTPEYMSPEQVDPTTADIDTRTDIYSLGVVLYDLLSGELPIQDEPGSGFLHLQQRILVEDPPRPSTLLLRRGPRAAAIAARRGTDPGSLARALRGDLDSIVMKALEKDRVRRYETANALALDIGRFLAHEPIAARPPSKRYRALKFVRRNRLGVALASLLALALFAGSIGTTVGLVQTRREARKANRERQKAEEITEFLKGMLSQVSPEKAQGREITVRDALDVASAGIAQFGGEPEIEAELRLTIGGVYSDLGHFDRALPHLERAAALLDAQFGPDHLETIRAHNRRGRCYLGLARPEDAAALWAAMLPVYREKWGPEHADTLVLMQNLAAAHQELRRYDLAEPLLVQLLEARRRTLGPEHPQTTATLNNLGMLCLDSGRYERAQAHLAEALHIRRATLGATNPRTLGSASNLGDLYLRTGRHAEAEELLREADEGLRHVVGADHPDTLDTVRKRAENLLRLGQLEAAERLALEAWQGLNTRYGPADERTSAAGRLFVELYDRSGRPELAATWRARLPAP